MKPTYNISRATWAIIIQALSVQAKRLDLSIADNLRPIKDMGLVYSTGIDNDIIKFFLDRILKLSCPHLEGEAAVGSSQGTVTMIDYCNLQTSSFYKHPAAQPEVVSSYKYWDHDLGIKGQLTPDQMAFLVKFFRIFGFVLVYNPNNRHATYALYSMHEVNKGYISSESGKTALQASLNIINTNHCFTLPDTTIKFSECATKDALMVQPAADTLPNEEDFETINAILALVGSSLIKINADTYVLKALPEGSLSLNKVSNINLNSLFAGISIKGEFVEAQNEWLRTFLASGGAEHMKLLPNYQLVSYPNIWVVLSLQAYAVIQFGTPLTFGRFVGHGWYFEPVWLGDPTV